ncbi:hypothetical protein [Microcystis phage Mwe-JY25]
MSGDELITSERLRHEARRQREASARAAKASEIKPGAYTPELEAQRCQVTAEFLAAAALKIERLERALKPFADFAPALLEWRSGSGMLLQPQWPESRPVLRGDYPKARDVSVGVVTIYASHFREAATAVYGDAPPWGGKGGARDG